MSIEVKNLEYTYGEGTAFVKKALNGIDLEVKSGEFVGLIGHTGSGKSTLIQHLNGLLKSSSGQIRIGDETLHADGVNMNAIRQKVGLVFQYPEHQLFEMSIYRDVAFGPKNMKLDEEEIDRRVKKALSIVSIDEDMYEDSPFDLSGGQKRRVAIAGVLAMEPEILILDEPTAGLDPKGRDEILGEIKKLHDELGITVILVSHSMEDIARFVDRVIVMDEGLIKMDGSAKDVFRHSVELEEMGLAVPQVAYLVKALNEKGFELSEEIITIDEAKEAILKRSKNTQRN